jgi:hypothetical protein
MQRREFIALLGASATWPIAGYAQQPGKIFRIGFLGFGSAATWANRIEALRGGLRDLGYVDGARPGGNITGLSGLGADLAIKALEILKEAVPNATRASPYSGRPQRLGTPVAAQAGPHHPRAVCRGRGERYSVA